MPEPQPQRWQKSLAKFKETPTEATALLTVGASKRNESLDAAEHAAWTVVCTLILNLDEVLTRE